MTNVVVVSFLLALCVRIVMSNSNGAPICDANLALVTNPPHPNVNPLTNAIAPLCEIPNESTVTIAQGASITIRLYHGSGTRKILGWLLYVTDSKLVRRGNFTFVTPNNNGALSGTRGAACTDSSTITHSSPVATNEVSAVWRMPTNAQDGIYSFQALVLTADSDGSNQKFFLPRCSSVCLTTSRSCATQNKDSLQGGEGYLEIYGEKELACSSSDTLSPCLSGLCDTSADPHGLTGVCQATYVSHTYLNALSGRRCDFGGYSFNIPLPGSGFEVLVSGGICSPANLLSIALTSDLMKLTNANGTLFVRALQNHNCVKLGCKLNAWKNTHRGYFDKDTGEIVTKFDLTATPNQNYFCMLPAPSDGECYCDDACSRLRDCCADFAYTCKTSLGANVSP
jgi:hypothetical protein